MLRRDSVLVPGHGTAVTRAPNLADGPDPAGRGRPDLVAVPSRARCHTRCVSGRDARSRSATPSSRGDGPAPANAPWSWRPSVPKRDHITRPAPVCLCVELW